MKILKIAAALGLLCLPLATLSTQAQAASAHNSQAGANGSTKNNAAPIRHHMMMHRKHMKRM